MAREFIIHRNGASSLSATVGERLGGARLWAWDADPEKCFTIRGPLRKGAPFRKSGITAAPDLLDVTDLKDGEDKTLLAGKVLVSTLTENYPDDSYVGRSFRCVQGPVPPGKRYKSMEVYPLDLNGPAPDEPKAKGKGRK